MKTMRSLISVILAAAFICIMLPASVFAYDPNEMDYIDGMLYIVLDHAEQTCAAAQLDDFSKKDVVIPEKGIHGYTVIQLGAGGYGGVADSDIESITLPDTIKNLRYGINNCKYLKSIRIPDSIEWISSGAFRGCYSLEEIILPNKPVMIDMQAFNDCGYYYDETNWEKDGTLYVGNHLASVREYVSGVITVKEGTIDVVSGAFYGCNTVEGVIFPEGLQLINYGAFFNAAALKFVYLPKSLTKISDVIFDNNPYLTDIYFGGTKAEWKAMDFGYGDGSDFDGLTIHYNSQPPEYEPEYGGECGANARWSYDRVGKTLTLYGSGATYDYSTANPAPWSKYKNSIESVVVAENIGRIGAYSFNNCQKLENATLCESVEQINLNAFANCNKLTNVRYLGDSAGWESIVIASGNNALKNAERECDKDYFAQCGDNAYCYYDDRTETLTVKGYGDMFDYEFGTTYYWFSFRREETYYVESTKGDLRRSNAPWINDDFTVRHVIIEDGITSIGKRAFADLQYLESVSIPESVTRIGEYAFYRCACLREFNIPSGVKTLENYMLYYNVCIENLTIPQGVQTIKTNALLLYSTKEIHVPSSISTIEERGIVLKDSQAELFYDGSQNQFISLCDKTGFEVGQNVICHFLDEVTDDNLQIAGASVALQSDLSVKYFIKKALINDSGYDDACVEFQLNGRSTVVSDHAESGEYYVYTFSGISPAEINDTITAFPIGISDGVKHYGKKLEYSIVSYCTRQLSKISDSKTARLLVDLLNYGAASQEYVKSEKEPANASLTAKQKLLGTQTAREYSSVMVLSSAPSGAKAKISGATLVLNKAIDIQIFITASSVKDMSVKVYKNGELVDTLTGFTKSGKYNVATFNKLDPSMLSDEYTFTVCDKNGNATSGTLTYSVESYAARTLENASSSDELKALVTAMMNYGDSAKSYIN